MRPALGLHAGVKQLFVGAVHVFRAKAEVAKVDLRIWRTAQLELQAGGRVSHDREALRAHLHGPAEVRREPFDLLFEVGNVDGDVVEGGFGGHRGLPLRRLEQFDHIAGRIEQ